MPKTTTIRRASLLVLMLAAMFFLLGTGEPSDARFNRLGHQLMCMCGCNQILLECNHVGCSYSDRMRKELQAAIDRGDNDDLILQGFVQNYGSTVLAAPTTKGFNRLAWIIPPLIAVLALGGAVVVVRTWKRRAHPAAAVAGFTPGRLSPEAEAFRRRAREETE